jgi:preprotein translocase subunit YajC
MLDWFISSAMAQDAAPAEVAEPSFWVQILPLVVIFAIFYFFVIRPQSKKIREHQSLIQNLQRGDEVITGGGIIGKITRVHDNEFTVEIADDVRVRVKKSTVADVMDGDLVEEDGSEA